MKAKYLFGIAMLILLGACSSDDELLEVKKFTPEGGTIHFTATIDSKGTSEGLTRALTEEGDKITASWTVGEKIALFYNIEGDEDEQCSQAAVTAVDEMTGVATIEAELDENVKDNTPVKLIYPYNYSGWYYDDMDVEDFFLGGGLDYMAKFFNLNSISIAMDARRGNGTIIRDGDEAALNGSVSLDPLFAICKFTFIGEDDQPLTINRMEIVNATTNKMIRIFKPNSYYIGSVFYAVMPPLDGVSVRFRGFDETDVYKATATATLEVGKYYKPTVKMKKIPTPVPLSQVTDDYIGFTVNSDGMVYPPRRDDVGAVAIIGYVGANGSADTSTSNDWRGLAVAINEFSKEGEYSGDAKYSSFSWTFEEYGNYEVTDAVAINDLNGISNTSSMPVDEFIVKDYPSNEVKGYTHTLGYALSQYPIKAPEGSSGWFIPALGQWVKVLNAYGAGITNSLNNNFIKPRDYNSLAVFEGYPGGRFRVDHFPLTGKNGYRNYSNYWTSTRASSESSYGQWKTCVYLIDLYYEAPRQLSWGYGCALGGNAYPFFAF